MSKMTQCYKRQGFGHLAAHYATAGVGKGERAEREKEAKEKAHRRKEKAKRVAKAQREERVRQERARETRSWEIAIPVDNSDIQQEIVRHFLGPLTRWTARRKRQRRRK